jgi:hypothetical protein
MAHLFTLLACGNSAAVAWWSNALSAVAGGCTVMFLFWTIRLLQQMVSLKRKASADNDSAPRGWNAIMPALVGSLCYLFCDTAWFSAVESEVYSLAMLLASAMVWAMMRWYHCPDRTEAQRWLLLIALLLGLGICTHLLTLLTTPALLLLFIFKTKNDKQKTKKLTASNLLVFSFYLIVFFIIGLSPYLIIPIRANADTPINEGHPATSEEFKSYLLRDQYEKAPLYPRMWRHHEHDAEYAASWSGGDTTLLGNTRYYFTYQLTYMYLRYLMWNFAGRYNDRQGFGSPQNGQFVTGIPPIDRMLVGTSAPMPKSLPTRGHNVYYLLPLLLGILGMTSISQRKRAFWVVMTLFLMGGVVLNLYLNHPCYEPRERDYAYILSFYAFCIFIAFGAEWLMDKTKKLPPIFNFQFSIFNFLLMAVPLLMACQNWDDHDRSHRYIARDAAANILNSCEHDERGTVLFTYGDNDTFPLWYIQSVEQERPDIRVENVNLMGTQNFVNLLSESITIGRPIYFTHYAYKQYRHLFPEQLQLEGNAYRLMPETCDSVAVEPFYRHAMQQMGWHQLEGVYIDETGCKFIEQYWRDIVLLADNLCHSGESLQAARVLTKTLGEIPLHHLQDPTLIRDIAQAFEQAGSPRQAQQIEKYLQHILREQLAYYHTLPPQQQVAMPYTIGMREELVQ